MNFKLLLALLSIFILLLVLPTTSIIAQEVPPPYAGVKNPFAWDDTSAREAGKTIYQQSCLGCHGVNGSSISAADFSTADYSQSLEKRTDFAFWILSEGRLDKGMPPFKPSLSEEQRWQLLTYLWSLGGTASLGVAPPPTKPPPEETKGSLLLTVPRQAQTGQPLTMIASLRDRQDKPIENAQVKFLIKTKFFTSGLMEIGEAVTNSQGEAIFKYSPLQTGDVQIVARYEATETAAMLTLAEADEPLNQAAVGIRLPALGKEVFIGPESALGLGEAGEAPASALRLPGGILSWLLLFVAIVILVWFTYFRVMYQVFRIPIRSEIRDTDTRYVPLVGLVMVVVLGVLLVLLIITGPYSHFHLPR